MPPAPPADPVEGLTVISEHFSDEIRAVDPELAVVPIIVEGYAEDEWSYNGLVVFGGSVLACESAASELMYVMGFRWPTPNPEFWKRPTSIPTNLTRARTRFWMPYNYFLTNYGHNWAAPLSASTAIIQRRQRKWATLNNVLINYFPAGHRWEGIINANIAYFNANPQLRISGKPTYLNMSVTGADFDNLVMISAAQLLMDKASIVLGHRTHLDATDGDEQSSDLIFAYTKAVVDRMRIGTTPIGTHPAHAGIPDMQVGIYGYGFHALPPSFSVSPGVYVQVALGYNKSSLTYPQLIDGHGAKADVVMMREYWGVQDWFKGKPMMNGRLKPGYFERYNGFHASGVRGGSYEQNDHWLSDMVGFQYGIRKLKTGSFTWDDALDDIMPCFNNDPAVRELYELWGDPYKTFGLYYLRVSMEIVDRMVDGAPYKIHFQRYLTILYAREKLPPKDPTASPDPFPDALNRYFGWVTGVREDEVMQSYAFIRNEGNTAMNLYPALKFSAIPPPPWMSAPWLAKPTQADFDAALAQISIETERDEDLDSSDLVLVTSVVPRVGAGTPPAGMYSTQDVANFIFVVQSGTGTVTFTQTANNAVVADGYRETFEYGPGTYFLNYVGEMQSTWTGGYLFLDTFPRIWKSVMPSIGGGYYWFYVPSRMAGEVKLIADSRWWFVDQSGNRPLYPVTDDRYVSPANLGPGQIAVQNLLTVKNLDNYNCNRYLSPAPNVALLPRPIAEEEGFARRRW